MDLLLFSAGFRFLECGNIVLVSRLGVETLETLCLHSCDTETLETLRLSADFALTIWKFCPYQRISRYQLGSAARVSGFEVDDVGRLRPSTELASTVWNVLPVSKWGVDGC